MFSATQAGWGGPFQLPDDLRVWGSWINAVLAVSTLFAMLYILQTDASPLTARQIEAARRAISRHVKRGGRIWIRVFPDKPISTKPAEVRMGNGKGNPEYYVAEIQPGKMLYEIVGVPEELAREAFRLAAAKLSVTTTFVTRTVR